MSLVVRDDLAAIRHNGTRPDDLEKRPSGLDGTAVEALCGTAAAIVLPIVLLGGLSGCTAIPNTTASPHAERLGTAHADRDADPDTGRHPHRDALGDRGWARCRAVDRHLDQRDAGRSWAR